jgi:hypothetical protein
VIKSFQLTVQKIKKFDNDINMKVVLGKDPYRKKRNPGNHKMPIDFIDQLSKFEKPYWTSEGRLSLVRLLTSLPIKIYKPKML